MLALREIGEMSGATLMSIDAKLTELAHTSAPAILFVTAGFCLTGITISASEGSHVVLAIAVAGTIVGFIRAILINSFQNEQTQKSVEWNKWDKWYGLGAYAFSSCIAALSVWSLIFGSISSQLIAVTTAIAYSTGVIVHVSVKPKIAKTQLLLMHLPVIIASLSQLDVHSVVLCILHILFAIAGLKMIGHVSATLTGRLEAERELLDLATRDSLTGL